MFLGKFLPFIFPGVTRTFIQSRLSGWPEHSGLASEKCVCVYVCVYVTVHLHQSYIKLIRLWSHGDELQNIYVLHVCTRTHKDLPCWPASYWTDRNHQRGIRAAISIKLLFFSNGPPSPLPFYPSDQPTHTLASNDRPHICVESSALRVAPLP